MHNLYSFAQLLIETELTGSDNVRQDLLESYFSRASDSDACWAIYLLTDKQRTRFLKSDELREHFLTYSTTPEWLFDAANNHVDDIAECISLILKNDDATKPQTSSTSLNELLSDQLPNFRKLKTLQEKKNHLKTLWDGLSSDEVYVLNKVLTGSFRGGNLKSLVIPALASILGKSEAAITYALSGKNIPTSSFFQNLKKSDHSACEPYAFEKASPWIKSEWGEIIYSINDLHFEWKYDGIRAQLIKRNGEVFLWSKAQELLNEQFPDIVELGQELENGTVLDGEIVGWRSGQITMMNGLGGRLERKKPTKQILTDLPVRFIAFDILEHNSTSTKAMSFSERLKILQSVDLSEEFLLAQEIKLDSLNKLEDRLKIARQENADGIIIRHKTKVSTDDEANYWTYQAPPLRLLAVLTYVQGNIYSFSLRQNDDLITFTKIENHLANKDELKHWIKGNSLERFGPVTSVKTQQIFEIAFDNIVESKRHKSGLSLKNPKIVSWKQNLTLEDIDDLETAKSLI